MKQYYNVGASLPFLHEAGISFPAYSEFLSICEPWLNEGEFQVLLDISVSGSSAAAEILPEYVHFDSILRQNLAMLREKKLKRSNQDREHAGADFDPEVDRAIQDFRNQNDPLAGEISLDHARWAFLDSLQVGHYFDIRFLTVYALKLQLLERRKSFNRETGTEHFTAAYNAVWEEIQHHVPKTDSGANI